MKQPSFILLGFIALGASAFGQVTYPSINTAPFLGQEMLGRVENTSVTVNVATTVAMQVYFEYGTASGSYTASTAPQSTVANTPLNIVLGPLTPNTRYYYRMQYAPAGSSSFTPRTEHSFVTQKPRGTAFTFVLQADPHLDNNSNPAVYQQTLANMLADKPDFLIDLGDNMLTDKLDPQGVPVDSGASPTAPGVLTRTQLHRSYYDLATHSIPLFVTLGNHEGEWGTHLNGTPNNMAIWNTQDRTSYFVNPAPDSFYSGDTNFYDVNGAICVQGQSSTCGLGQRKSYYSWEWGDALFIVLDPFWNQTPGASTGNIGTQDCCQKGTTQNAQGVQTDWSLTLGDAQYAWLQTTLANSTAKYKFVFSHNLVGGWNYNGTGAMRGGVEAAKYSEWGGYNLDGTYGFATYRPKMAMPIHQLLLKYNVTAYFHGHDHLYAHQQLDGLTYQEVPQPSASNGTNEVATATSYGYTQGKIVNGRGYVRVTVDPTNGATVQFVQTWIPTDKSAPANGTIGDSYTIPASGAGGGGGGGTPCTYALNLSGQGFDASGGAGTIGVTAGAGCAWSVTGVPGWLTLSSGGSGTGNGTVSYQVLANSGAGRSAVMTVGGVGFTVEQTAGAGAIAGLSAVGSLAQVNSQGGWSFELDAVNVGSSPATARVSFTDPSGNALPMPLTFPQQVATGAPELASTLDRTINANGRLVVTSSGPVASPALLGSGQLWSNGSVSGFGIFSFPALQWNAVVPLETRNASKYSLPFDNTNPLHTGVALSNITTSAVSVSVTILNDAGTQIRTDTINLPAQGYQQFLLDTQYTQTAGARGTVQFSTAGSGQISVLGVRANGAALTTLPVLSNVDPAGGSISDVTYNGGFTSTFYLVNTGTNAASFTLSFYNQTGAAANVPLVLPQTGETLTTTALTRTLAAGQMLEVATQANDGAANISGSAQLTGNVSGFEIFRWNTYGQEASVPLETRTPGSFALVFDNTSPLNTGVSLTNASSAAANITANVYDDQGNPLGSGLVNLAGRGQQVFMLPDKFPITAGKRGMVQFVVPTSGPISMIGIRTSGTTLTTVPILTMAATGPVITGTVPDAPANLSATPGNTTASIAFTAPANGGLPITSYIAACVGGGATFTGVATASPVVVTGLTNGTAYSCTVAATNVAGTGNPSASVSVTPVGVINTGSFVLTSSVGVNNGALPAAYTCDGTGSTPPLAWSGAPAGTTEYAILLSTIPAPGQLKYDWVLYHIPGTVSSLAKDSFLVGTVGVGDDGPGTTYDPPCSSGPGAKTYTITIYALSAAPTFSVPANQVTGTMVASAIAPLTLGTAQLNLNYTRFPTASGSNPQSPGYSPSCLYIRFSLQAAKDGVTSIGCDGTYAYISSIGMPIGSASDTMMTGITGTNLQVPTPTDFLGANGWKIPMNAVYNPNSATPVPSGPIGVAINGVPIFNPCVQNGCSATSGDTKALGQLDVCNGHSGRADDYHYHAAPNCMMAEQSTAYWNTHPVGWLLDGFALFGYQNADGSTPVKDSCGIAPMSGQAATLGGNTYPYTFAYHVQDTYPYITNNCVSGVPSPDLPNQASKYHPFRQPPVTPFTDSAMTLTTDATDGYQVLQFSSANPFTTTENGQDSYSNPPGTYKIRYKQVTGADLAALLALKQNANATACWNFQFVDSTGKTTQPSISYCKNNP